MRHHCAGFGKLLSGSFGGCFPLFRAGAAEGIRHAGGQLAAGYFKREGAGAGAGGHGADEAVTAQTLVR